uniref:Uncharacterized protein n=1 Tax=Rhizophora mucronata TaxID=61149 RepID=A0A2P2Q0X7_RHIMU
MLPNMEFGLVTRWFLKVVEDQIQAKLPSMQYYIYSSSASCGLCCSNH